VQGATVDRTFVLGSDELYREWGYTALSRHRERAQFYVTAPEPFLNQRALPLKDKQELVETVVRTFDDSRMQELAIEAIERDPQAVRAMRELERARELAGTDEARVLRMQEERDSTPWFRRAERRHLDRAVESNRDVDAEAPARVARRRDDIERLASAAAEPAMAE